MNEKLNENELRYRFEPLAQYLANKVGFYYHGQQDGPSVRVASEKGEQEAWIIRKEEAALHYFSWMQAMKQVCEEVYPDLESKNLATWALHTMASKVLLVRCPEINLSGIEEAYFDPERDEEDIRYRVGELADRFEMYRSILGQWAVLNIQAIKPYIHEYLNGPPERLKMAELHSSKSNGCAVILAAGIILIGASACSLVF